MISKLRLPGQRKKNNDYYILSFSGGKDSLALFLELLYRNYPLNEVVCFDTGMEFEAIYRVWSRVKKICKLKGIKFTVLYPKEPFLYQMLEKPVKYRSKPGYHYGYEWCGGTCRWMTAQKTKTMDSYRPDAIWYVGIAYDEQKRIKANDDKKVFPLVNWGITEKDALRICRAAGFGWEEYPGVDLYNYLDRVSCWCCANKNLKELRAMYEHLPTYWKRLKRLQRKIKRPFKKYGTIFQLEERFDAEK